MAVVHVSMMKNKFWLGSGYCGPGRDLWSPWSPPRLAFPPPALLSPDFHPSIPVGSDITVLSHLIPVTYFSVLLLVHVGAAVLYRWLRATSSLNLYCMSYNLLSGTPGDKSNALTASATKWWKFFFCASSKRSCWALTPSGVAHSSGPRGGRSGGSDQCSEQHLLKTWSKTGVYCEKCLKVVSNQSILPLCPITSRPHVPLQPVQL